MMGSCITSKSKTNKIISVSDGVSAIEVIRKNGDVVHFLIDEEDANKVRLYCWYYHEGYCCRSDECGKQWNISWELLGKPEEGYLWHHVNGNPRDNRKCNLKLVPWSVNNFFKKAQANYSTGKCGISKYSTGAIVALIGFGGKRKTFKTMGAARIAREQFEREMEKQVGKGCG